MIPAFSPAISPSVPPRYSIWSSPMDVITHTAGFSTALVASSLPPSPVSRTAYSAPASAKARTAMPNRNSKKVGWASPSLSIQCTALRVSSNTAQNCASLICSPPVTIRSFIFTRWGDVKSPVRFPSERSIPSRYAHTEPFPFVPATWSTFICSCGSPRYLRKALVCSLSFFFVNFGISSI